MKLKKIVLGVTVGGSSRLLDGQVSYFKNLGYDVYLLSPDHPKEHLFCKREGCVHLPVSIEKEIAPFKDLKTLIQIIRHLKKVKPDIVNVGTPKMGLLGILAAFLCGIGNRIYTCRGLRFETETGLKRKVLVLMEKLTVFLSKKVIYVSPSLRSAAVKANTANTKKAVVIGKGSSNGVNLTFFNSSLINVAKKDELIEKYQLQSCLVIGFVGRVSLHKGAVELVAAFEKIYKLYPNTRLMMIGHVDCSEDFKQRYTSNKAIIHVPFQDDVPLYMSLFDIFVLPSWREGFPNVPIQAAAMGIPVVVSDATGCVDAVKEGFNGKAFQCKNAVALERTLLDYIENPLLMKEHGNNGIRFAQEFESAIIWNGIDKLYKSMLC